jgi:hypothetical protein
MKAITAAQLGAGLFLRAHRIAYERAIARGCTDAEWNARDERVTLQALLDEIEEAREELREEGALP